MSNITGQVTLEGKPHGGVYVRLLGPSGEFVSEQYTKDDGKFTFHVAPGAWTLEARAAGAGTSTQTVEVAGNGDSDAVVAVDLGKA
jgi:uncharacterized protein DUF1416